MIFTRNLSRPDERYISPLQPVGGTERGFNTWAWQRALLNNFVDRICIYDGELASTAYGIVTISFWYQGQL